MSFFFPLYASTIYAYNYEMNCFLICQQIDLVCLSQTTNCAILHMDREGTHSKVAGFVLVSYTGALADRRASSSKLCQRKAELSEAGDRVGEGREGWEEKREIWASVSKSFSYVRDGQVISMLDIRIGNLLG